MTSVDPLLSWLARAGLAALFAVAAAHKLRAPRVFVATLGEYRLLPGVCVAPVAALTIGIELALVPGLLASSASALAGVVASALLLVYSAAIAVNLARGRRDIDCGCLGPARRQTLSGWLLVRNVGLLGVAALAALPPGARSFVWLDGVSFVAGLLVSAALFTAISGLGAVAPHPLEGSS